MLTTLVVAVSATTVVSAGVVLATMNFDAQNHWDPRVGLGAAVNLARSCVQRSQLMVSGCWSQVSRISQAARFGVSQRLRAGARPEATARLQSCAGPR